MISLPPITDKFEAFEFFITGIDIGLLTIDNLSDYVFAQLEENDSPDVMYCDIAMLLSKEWKFLRSELIDILHDYGYFYAICEEKNILIACYYLIKLVGERYENKELSLKETVTLLSRLGLRYKPYSEISYLEDDYELSEMGIGSFDRLENKVRNVLENNKNDLQNFLIKEVHMDNFELKAFKGSFEIFRYPLVTRGDIAKKVLLFSVSAFVLLLLLTVPLFIFMGRDSEKNRDAVRKVTSQETELSLLFVLAVLVLCMVCVVVYSIKLSRRIKRNYERWVSFKGTVYYVKADVPVGRSLSTPQRFNKVMQAQDATLSFLKDKENMRELLQSSTKPSFVTVLCAENAVISKECGRYAVIRFENGRKIKLYKDIIDYNILIDKFRR